MMKAVTERGLPANISTLVDTYSADKCKALYAKFVKNNTYIAPSFLREMGGLAPKDLNDPRLAYASPALRAEFEAGVKNFKPQGVANSRLLHETHYKVVKQMHAAGGYGHRRATHAVSADSRGDQRHGGDMEECAAWSARPRATDGTGVRSACSCRRRFATCTPSVTRWSGLSSRRSASAWHATACI